MVKTTFSLHKSASKQRNSGIAAYSRPSSASKLNKSVTFNNQVRVREFDLNSKRGSPPRKALDFDPSRYEKFEGKMSIGEVDNLRDS